MSPFVWLPGIQDHSLYMAVKLSDLTRWGGKKFTCLPFKDGWMKALHCADLSQEPADALLLSVGVNPHGQQKTERDSQVLID